MALTQNSLTGFLKKPDTTAWAGVELEITPVSLIVGEGFTIPAGTILVLTESDGYYETELYTLEDGVIGYTVKFPTGDVYLFEMPDEDSDLDELLGNELLNQTPTQILIALLQALIAASPATGSVGGVLSGSLPNPGFAVNMATQAELDSQVVDLLAAINSITGSPFLAQVNAKDYGASGSAVQTTGSITINTRSLTVADASSFNVGEDVFVEGAGLKGSGNDLISTITAKAGNVLTLDPAQPAASATVSGSLVQHDETRAILEAITELFALGMGGGKVICPSGTYRCNKEFSQVQTNGTTPVNAIIYPPFIDSATEPLHHFEIEGEFRTGTIWGLDRAEHGTIFITQLVGSGDKPSFFAAMGHVNTNPYQTGFNYVECMIKNCHIRVPDNPRIDAINFKNAVNATVLNVSCETASHPNDVPQPTNQSTGIHLPGSSNASRCNANDYNIIGFKDGINVGEHSDFSRGNIYRCWYGVVCESAGYVCKATNLSIEHTKVAIDYRSRGILDVQMDIERGNGSWWAQGDADPDIQTRNIGLGGTQDALFAHGSIKYVFSFEGGGSAHYTERIKTLGTNASYLELKNLFLPTQVQYHGADTTDPVAVLTAPANLATVFGDAVTVSATATDDREVVEVEFFHGTTSIGIDTTGTGGAYSVVWDTTLVSDDDYVLTAVARDQAGNEGTSASRTVTVDNAGGGAFAPTDLASLVFWAQNAYSDTPPVTLASVDSAVFSSVKDESAGAFHLSETGGNRPTYQTLEFDTNPGWLFNGSAFSLRNATLGAEMPTDFTVALIYRRITTHVSDGMILMFGDLAAGKRRAIWIKAGGTVTFSGYAANLDSSANVCDGNAHYIVITKASGVVKIRVDGAEVASGSPSLSAFVSQGFALGANFQGGEPSDGIIRDVVCCDTALTGTDLTDLEAFLADRAGL